MKDFKFDHLNKRWDRYDAFHKMDGGLAEFETGEVIVQHWVHPEHRRMYSKYGIQLVATTDADCPPLYLDKDCTKPVKKAWVCHHGMQELAIDHEQKVAVSYSARSYRDGGNKHAQSILGRHVCDARAYWSGSERLPAPLTKIRIQTPDANYKKVLSPIIVNEVLPALTAMYRMKPSTHGYGAGKYMAKRTWIDLPAEEIIANICDTPEWSLEQDLKQIAKNGFEYPRALEEVDFLYIKGGNDAPK